jgi:acyl-CoA synthetase (AMP-forming)/AMP-acid ligase II
VNDDAQGTELPRAYIVAKGGPHLNLPNVQNWLAGRVAPHKKLRGGVIVIDAVPKSPSGKILHKDLRARAADEY